LFLRQALTFNLSTRGGGKESHDRSQALLAVLMFFGFFAFPSALNAQAIVHRPVPPDSFSSNDCGCQATAQPAADHVDASSRATSTCYFLYPYNLHLVQGVRSAVPLQVRDQAGDVVASAITFYGYDTTLISISTDGYVTPKRSETSTEIGTGVSASVGGQQVANSCIVRVLSRDYNLSYTEARGQNTILYYPSPISGENISAYVAQYEMPQVNDYAYSIQESHMGLKPFGGCKQIIELDFAETERQSVCGISGNPVRLGWIIAGNEWQNCFLVPFIPPRSPQWGVIFHELGHNFTWPSYTFAVGLGIFDYSEGIATAISLQTSLEILQTPSRYPLGTSARTSIEWVLNRDTTDYIRDLNNWLSASAPFSSYNPNLVDGLWLYYRRTRPTDFSQRFFLPLQPQYQNQVSHLFSAVNAAGNNGKHTFFAALVSAAVGKDLSSEFITIYHLPVVQPLFNDLYQAFNRIIGLAVFAEDRMNIVPSQFHLEQNYPNPFNPSTMIEFSLPERSFVKLTIMNLLGQEIETLIAEEREAGSYRVKWNAGNFPTGTYFYRLQAGGFAQIKKLILLK
jgi:hypothetical protein